MAISALDNLIDLPDGEFCDPHEMDICKDIDGQEEPMQFLVNLFWVFERSQRPPARICETALAMEGFSATHRIFIVSKFIRAGGIRLFHIDGDDIF